MDYTNSDLSLGFSSKYINGDGSIYVCIYIYIYIDQGSYKRGVVFKTINKTKTKNLLCTKNDTQLHKE